MLEKDRKDHIAIKQILQDKFVSRFKEIVQKRLRKNQPNMQDDFPKFIAYSKLSRKELNHLLFVFLLIRNMFK
jgi:hypothetical protein